jgi:hypothetical protein
MDKVLSGAKQRSIYASVDMESDDYDGFVDIDELLPEMPQKGVTTGGIAEAIDVGARNGRPVASSHSSEKDTRGEHSFPFRGIDLLYLLVLEATGDILNGINVYRRAGILKLRYIDPSSYASPELIAKLKKAETSITTRLGLRKKPRKARMPPNAVFREVKKGNWMKETVMIV